MMKKICKGTNTLHTLHIHETTPTLPDSFGSLRVLGAAVVLVFNVRPLLICLVSSPPPLPTSYMLRGLSIRNDSDASREVRSRCHFLYLGTPRLTTLYVHRYADSSPESQLAFRREKVVQQSPKSANDSKGRTNPINLFCQP